MTFDVELIFESERRDPDLGEELLEAFLAAAPDCDPVVDQNTDTGRATVAFEVNAAEINAATVRTADILQHASEQLGIRQPIIGFHVDAATDQELQAA